MLLVSLVFKGAFFRSSTLTVCWARKCYYLARRSPNDWPTDWLESRYWDLNRKIYGHYISGQSRPCALSFECLAVCVCVFFGVLSLQTTTNRTFATAITGLFSRLHTTRQEFASNEYRRKEAPDFGKKEPPFLREQARSGRPTRPQ